MQKNIEQIFYELIKTSLNLPDNYGYDKDGNEIPCVVIANQNIKLFNTEHLQITIKTISSQLYSNNIEYVDDVNGFKEVISMNDKRMLQIDVYSKNNEARQRYWEVQACLNSTLAEQLQEKYQFQLSGISQVNNISGLDGGSDINRYTIRVNALLWHKKENLIDYYNKFPLTAETEQGIFTDLTIQE